MNDRLLSIYLNDHLAGASTARMLAGRCRANNRETPLGAYLGELLDELTADTEVVEEIMRRIGARKDPLKQAAAWAAERVGRLKLNGSLLAYSDLSRLEEIEGLCLGVGGKLSLWRTLERLAASDPRIAFGYKELISRAQRQRRRLEGFRLEAAATAFAS